MTLFHIDCFVLLPSNIRNSLFAGFKNVSIKFLHFYQVVRLRRQLKLYSCIVNKCNISFLNFHARFLDQSYGKQSDHVCVVKKVANEKQLFNFSVLTHLPTSPNIERYMTMFRNYFMESLRNH